MTSLDFFQGWQEVPDGITYDNAFKIQWEAFLKHVALDTPFPWTLREGAKGIQLAELGLQSWKQSKGSLSTTFRTNSTIGSSDFPGCCIKRTTDFQVRRVFYEPLKAYQETRPIQHLRSLFVMKKLSRKHISAHSAHSVGIHDVGLDIPFVFLYDEHLYFFTMRSLCRLLCQEDFDVLYSATPRRNQSVDSRLPLGRQLKKAVYGIEQILKMGPLIEVFARKR